MPELTASRLRELLHYDPETGIFRWKVNRGGPMRKGDIAGTRMKIGYIAICVDQILYYGHRLAHLYVTGEWPKDEIDHRDLNKSNNAWLNLRPANSSQNKVNRPARGQYPRGVTFHRQSGLFTASAHKNGKRYHLGYHKTPEAAHAAYCAAALKLHGEFARAS